MEAAEAEAEELTLAAAVAAGLANYTRLESQLAFCLLSRLDLGALAIVPLRTEGMVPRPAFLAD